MARRGHRWSPTGTAVSDGHPGQNATRTRESRVDNLALGKPGDSKLCRLRTLPHPTSSTNPTHTNDSGVWKSVECGTTRERRSPGYKRRLLGGCTLRGGKRWLAFPVTHKMLPSQQKEPRLWYELLLLKVSVETLRTGLGKRLELPLSRRFFTLLPCRVLTMRFPGREVSCTQRAAPRRAQTRCTL